MGLPVMTRPAGYISLVPLTLSLASTSVMRNCALNLLGQEMKSI